MHCKSIPLLTLLLASTCVIAPSSHAAEQPDACHAKAAVDNIIRPLMERHNIPGMAIGVIVNGQRCAYNFGVMSKDTKQAVTDETLFEIGSISKMMTATLAAYAQAEGTLSLSDKVTKHVPALRGSSFDKVSILNLGTYTAGGLPLQVPDEVQTGAQLMSYYKNWKPEQAPGTSRTYSNPSVGLLAIATAASLNMPFEAAMEQRLFPALGLTHTHLTVPPGQMKHYAQGYNRNEEPVRANPGPVALPAYGVKTTATDLMRFIALNMAPADLAPAWRQAVTDTQFPRYQVGEMTQAFGWELYPYPLTLEKLLAGNSERILIDANPVTRARTPSPPSVLINKTGSTAGFANYVAFVPARGIGVVMQSNKSYPIPARVAGAYDILSHLESLAGVKR